MEANIADSTKLSNLQLELLKLYSHNVSDSELADIRKMLAEYFAIKVDDEMDQVWEENNWDEKTIEDWKNEHMRASPKK